MGIPVVPLEKGSAARLSSGDCAGAGKAATLSVSDSGVGIAPEDVPKLFNRFERIQNRQTSHVGGTGLGLFLSRELAHQHGGEIEVESRPGAGSTFTLTLPLTQPMQEAAPAAEPVTITEPVATTPRLHVLPPESESESETRLG